MGFQELLNRFHARGILLGQFVKAYDIKSHFPMKRIGCVAQAPEKSAEGFPAILELQAFRTDGKPHPGSLRLDFEQFEKLDEIRVVLLIENDKPGIHLIGPGFARYLDRVYVTARFCIGFEKRNVMLLGKQVGTCEARDTRSYDSYFHRLAYVVFREWFFL